MSSVGEARLMLPADLNVGAAISVTSAPCMAIQLVSLARHLSWRLAAELMWRAATRYSIRLRPSWAQKAKRPA